MLVIGLSTSVPEEAAGAETVLELMGLRHEEVLSSCAACLGLTAILFLGPLVQGAYILGDRNGVFETRNGGGISNMLTEVKSDVWDSFATRQRFWISMRNYVLAPFTEEFVFRVCVVRLAVAGSLPKGIIIFVTPFCFGMAHAHHFFEHV